MLELIYKVNLNCRVR